MTQLEKIEAKMIQSVSNCRLRSSLAMLRQAVEDIWATDAPRIIHDYTDHGVSHCERIIGFASKLLEANDGRNLSEQESYLLLSGIYLHDIGMQCDVIAFPEVKEKAETLGAVFDIDFQSRTSGDYNFNEQNAIRKNHQYLSAAWLDHAHRTGKTVLGPAAKTIPLDLVDDLMDICLHHAKLSIVDCPASFKLDPTQRKQLIAAILRLADELDIDGHRVSIETVKNYRLEPTNALYWWLHNRTSVIFIARNVLLLTIRLHTDDFNNFGLFINEAFIRKFQSKNQSVLSVLARDGIPIVISHDSKVEEFDRVEPLPLEIVNIIQSLQTDRSQLSILAEEVASWLSTIRYEISESHQIDNRVLDMLATLDFGTVKQRVLVRCICGDITSADVAALDLILDRKTPQGWMISDKRVSMIAQRRALESESIQVFRLVDFLQQKVWGSYFDSLTSMIEKEKIPDLYVDMGCFKQLTGDEGRGEDQQRFDSLDGYVDDWLWERGKVHISLLGDFGGGKTWFCRHFAYRQLQRYFEDPLSERLPLLITLRLFTKALTAQQLINDALLEQYRLPFVGSGFEIFKEMNRRGKLLLILDGFDEMARQVDYQTVVDNFWELAELIDEGSKVILTSRTEYFRWAKESENILGGKEFGKRTIVLSPPKFEVLCLEPLTDIQIKQVIARRLGTDNGQDLATRILGMKNLAEMARKPVVLELLLAALDEENDEVLNKRAEVYLNATNKLLLRNIDTKRTFTSTSDKLFFLCELAWQMIKTGELRIHYRDIPSKIMAYFGDRIRDQHELDLWDYDLRNQTLLHRNAAGYYEFAHKSLAEYFVAFKFAAELGCLSPNFIQTYRDSDDNRAEISFIRTTPDFSTLPLPNTNLEVVQFFEDLASDVLSEALPSYKSSNSLGEEFRNIYRDLLKLCQLKPTHGITNLTNLAPEAMGKTLGSNLGSILLRFGDFMTTYILWPEENFNIDHSHLNFRWGEGLSGAVAVSGKPHFFHDISPKYFSPTSLVLDPGYHISSVICIPLMGDGTFGVCNFYSNKAHNFSDQDMKRAQKFGFVFSRYLSLLGLFRESWQEIEKKLRYGLAISLFTSQLPDC